MKYRIALICLLAAVMTIGGFAAAESTDPDYEKTASFESAGLMALVKNLRPVPNWIGGEDRFWVSNQTAEGIRFQVVEAATGATREAFDHTALAAALAEAGLEGATPEALPITALDLNGTGIKVFTAGGAFVCAADASTCEKADLPMPSPAERPSPDGSRVAFIKNHDIWLRDTTNGSESALTDDGEPGFAYGDLGFDLTRVERRRTNAPKPLTMLNWSPDGRYIAAMRVDVREVPQRLYVTEYLPPDDTFTVAHLDYTVVAGDRLAVDREISIIDTETGEKTTTAIDSEKLHDFAPMHFSANHMWWNLPELELFIVTADNGGQTYGIAAINIATGKARMVVEESEEHYYAFNARDYNAPNFHVTTDGKEAIFYSQRSGAGHLYLYDAATGAQKNAITEGPWVVFDLIRVDETNREIYFTAGGREEVRDPYFAHLYRVSFDGGAIELLTPENAAHEFYTSGLPIALFGGPQSQFSPSGEYFVDVFSTIEQPPSMVIRSKDGVLVKEVLRADISALEAHGWKPPERFVVKAADGDTDLWGVMFKPSDFDPAMKYAVVDQTYPGPQIDSGPHSFIENFASLTTGNAQATAEAGLVVIGFDGRGTTRRDRAFRYAFAGTKDVFGAADHKAAIENLAKKHPYVDASRVGITGASFGGYGSMRAALLYPEFFKVVVSHVGPHEYLHSVTSGISVERFFGVPGSERDIYEDVSNIAIIDNLEADLMLVYGEIDENVPFRSAIAVYDALIKADKDFTTYVIPNANHGLASRNPYIVKRQLRFFYEHLGGPVAR